MHDPMEKLVADALVIAGHAFTTDEGGGNPAGLDFYLSDHDVHIEVKRFHTPRVAEQMSRADNVIVAQGKAAVEFLAALIEEESKSHVPTAAMLDAGVALALNVTVSGEGGWTRYVKALYETMEAARCRS